MSTLLFRWLTAKLSKLRASNNDSGHISSSSKGGLFFCSSFTLFWGGIRCRRIERVISEEVKKKRKKKELLLLYFRSLGGPSFSLAPDTQPRGQFLSSISARPRPAFRIRFQDNSGQFFFFKFFFFFFNVCVVIPPPAGFDQMSKSSKPNGKNISFSFSFYAVVSKLPKRNKKKRERKKQKIIHKAFHTRAPSPNHFGPRVRWRATVKTLQPPLEAFSMMFPSFSPLALLLLLLTLNWVMHSLFFFFFRTTTQKLSETVFFFFLPGLPSVR